MIKTSLDHDLGILWKMFKNLRQLAKIVEVEFYIVKKNYIIVWRYKISPLLLKNISNISLVRCTQYENIFNTQR